jgi:hypothetical protein
MGESAIVRASVPASRSRALRSKETKAKLKLTPFETKFTVWNSRLRSN